MKTTVEPLGGNKVKLSVEVAQDEMDAALDAAFRRIAQQVRVPGFRPGKAPRRLLEARVGRTTARHEALTDSLPEFYAKALEQADLEPIAPPEIDITAGRDEGPVSFDAVVEVMPQVSVAGYDGLRVVVGRFDVEKALVDSQIDRLRQQYGELRSVARPAREGDHVSVDRKLTRHSEVVAAVDDELYEVGSKVHGPELDAQLEGARAGDILKFNAQRDEAGEVTFTVLVKDVREKVLPEINDEWASEASEFETVEELRRAIRDQIGSVRRLEAALTVREKVVDALVELVDEEMPEALVTEEMERRVRLLDHRLTHQGMGLAQYLESAGRSREDLLGEMREDAVRAVKADVGLRAIAEQEGIEVTDVEVDEEIARMAESQGRRPAAVRRELESEGRLPAVRSNLRKSKTLEWLIGHTEFVDEEGRVVDREQLKPPSAEDAG